MYKDQKSKIQKLKNKHKYIDYTSDFKSKAQISAPEYNITKMEAKHMRFMKDNSNIVSINQPLVYQSVLNANTL